ncbi:hypothetical protein [Nocardia jiangxiensis]|uniref:Uncharacterized protein n=1 Tax=Nocardia jiangxiensis TaxID=282685 RepID=A0ABW6S1F8_9NOCA|nr:hypothetical protein [Nocardia jiangxiensis]
MESFDPDYSQVPISELTARLENSQSRCAVLAHDFPVFKPVLTEWHEIWSDAVAVFPDPVGALRSEVADSGAIDDPIGALLCQLADSGDILTPLLRRVSYSRAPIKAKYCRCHYG